jgi:hypothetical protein
MRNGTVNNEACGLRYEEKNRNGYLKALSHFGGRSASLDFGDVFRKPSGHFTNY